MSRSGSDTSTIADIETQRSLVFSDDICVPSHNSIPAKKTAGSIDLPGDNSGSKTAIPSPASHDRLASMKLSNCRCRIEIDPHFRKHSTHLGSDGGQRMSAPKDVRGKSVMPSRAPNTTPMNPGTARYGISNTSTTAMSKATSNI
jgi:hypothetical protein